MGLPDIKNKYSQFVLRVVLGLLFLIPGIGKLMNVSGTAGFLGSLGIPLAAVAVWLLIAAEVLGGLALIVGWQVRWAAIPLAIVMLVAIVTVAAPGASANPSGLLLHILAVAGLFQVFAAGPGAYAVGK